MHVSLNRNANLKTPPQEADLKQYKKILPAIHEYASLIVRRLSVKPVEKSMTSNVINAQVEAGTMAGIFNEGN